MRAHNDTPALIGRDADVAQVLDLLDGSPLVTLYGVAGVGKTSLAKAAAENAGSRFRDGVTWVDFVPVRDSAGVGAVLLSALGVRDTRGQPPIEAVCPAVTGRQMLLVLDNAEHVAPAVREVVASLLRHCPLLGVLVTSREPLGLDGETRWLVPSLAVPDVGDLPSTDELSRIASVALFVSRVRNFAPDYVLRRPDMLPVAQICAGLDGIPLAIEFAAARVRTLPVDAIAQRLDRALALFGETPAARPRHVTLRAALDWSHELLDEPERMLLRRLAVFAGSFTLDAAEEICSSDDLPRHGIAGHLSDLADRSLVVPPPPGAEQARFRLLETIRQYAQERLDEAGEEEVLLTRHSKHYVALVETAEPNLRRHGQLELQRRLIAEYANLRSVLQRSATPDGLSSDGIRIAAALGSWWWFFGQHVGDGRMWLEAAAATPQPADPTEARAWARALMQAGLMAWDRADLHVASSRVETAIPILDGTEPWHAAMAHNYRAFVAAIRGDLPGANQAFAEALRRFEEIGDRWGSAGISTANATVARLFGDVSGAQQAFEFAVTEFRAIGEENITWAPLVNLGQMALESGDIAHAHALFEEALDVALRFDNGLAACACLAMLGTVAVAEDDPVRAAELIAASDHLIEAMGGQHQPQNRARYDRVIADLRVSLGEQRFDEACERGRALSFERAVELARRERRRRPESTKLSDREHEVAQLVGRGLTNRQIAEALCISPHTAERHVERILAKLKMASRVEIATWVVREQA